MSRIAIVEKEKCNPIKCDYLCIKLCPLNRSGEECITKDKKIIIDEELCNGCGICQNRCPFKAISVINLPQELKAQPIHQYSKNGFRLYRLPAPMFGKVTGIIGKNGIGKTTALNILANIIKPNLGNLSKESSYEDLIKFFKGTEAQNFFEKLKNNEIVVSYKPQKVDDIPLKYKGKVTNLLKKVDEKNKLNEIVKILQIDNILNNNIENLSGGELQRVAIAAASLKKANLYIFDEPTSYLDIKQRLNIAKFIRSLADEKTAILVVEHDLIILDYLADLIYIMYGKESCYGICSSVKSAKSGINTYLEGYLKEENIKFRDKKIQFLFKPPIRKKSPIELTTWEKLTKKLDHFNLEVSSGTVNENEVIGILGENAIGKTTFIKLLAGILEPSKGKIDKKLKIAYKPQYIQASNDLVQDVLKNIKKEIILHLNLNDLAFKKVNELSGGELQKLAIASCLSQEADLYLLDEP
ncbi:MAG: ribosome biogenesis/translation initiation ATPase RLI, partial [Candidatus Woesearchaeota archaeon]